jgi:hypothetical protein
MSTKSRDQGKAQEIARRIMSDWDVGDLENLITERVQFDDKRRILSEIDPEYDALENEAIDIYEKLLKRLQNKEDQEALRRCSDIQNELLTTESICGFHLGFAAAVELLRKKP